MTDRARARICARALKGYLCAPLHHARLIKPACTLCSSRYGYVASALPILRQWWAPIGACKTSAGMLLSARPGADLMTGDLSE